MCACIVPGLLRSQRSLIVRPNVWENTSYEKSNKEKANGSDDELEVVEGKSMICDVGVEELGFGKVRSREGDWKRRTEEVGLGE